MNSVIQDIATLWLPVVTTVALPIAFKLAQGWLARQRWGKGAASFAGKAYISLMQKRQEKPGAPLQALIAQVVVEQGVAFASSYAATADKLGATTQDAQSRVQGELGALLAADPTISPAVPEAVRPPSVPLRAGLS